MEPSPSPEQLGAAEVELLLDIAESTLLTALDGGTPEPPALDTLPEPLHRTCGVFVSLHVGGSLNGCIGAMEAAEPLGHAVARLALSAAFADPRLPALHADDLPELTIEMSLLSTLTSFHSASWEHLVVQLRPGHDGLVVRAGTRQALFLPSVWEQLPHPEEFVTHLFHKAGLAPRSWPRRIETLRFTADRHHRHAGERHAA